jgi:formylglycine-generating enzyme required for sulfatase activity
LQMDEVVDDVQSEDGIEAIDVEEALEEDILDDLITEDALEDLEVDDPEDYVEEVAEDEEIPIDWVEGRGDQGFNEGEALIGDTDIAVDPETMDVDENLDDVPLEDMDEEDGFIVDADEMILEEDVLDLDISLSDLLEEYSDEGFIGEDGIKRAKYLAEGFNNALAAMDKYYNQYILIPRRKYIIGAKFPKRDERPEKKITLGPFYFGKFPVTNALFEIFIEKTGYKTTAEKVGYGTVYQGRYQRVQDEKTGLETLHWSSILNSDRVEGACWYQPFGPGSTLHNKRNHPVVQVSREDAMAFAAWTGKRLPTEDEWEAAARTYKGRELPWGEKMDPAFCNIEESCMGDTTPVDQYKQYANEWGITDTIGNVLEWTIDLTTSSMDESVQTKAYYFKGGSWVSGSNVRLYSRILSGTETHSNIMGFRCVAY